MHIRPSVSVLMVAISNPSSCLSALARARGVTPHKGMCAQWAFSWKYDLFSICSDLVLDIRIVFSTFSNLGKHIFTVIY